MHYVLQLFCADDKKKMIWPKPKIGCRQIYRFIVEYSSGVRTGGFGGQNPPLKILEKMKTFLERTAFFYTQIAEIAVFLCYPTCL